MAQKRPFRFLDLPREMRDMVYALLTADHDDIAEDKDDLDGRIIASLKCGPIVALLGVQRQFSLEYAEQIRRFSSLQIVDAHACCAKLSSLPNNVFDFVTKAECILLACYIGPQGHGTTCSMRRHIQQHHDWTQKLQGSLQQPLAISINLYLSGLHQVYDTRSSAPDHDLRECLKGLVEVNGIQQMVVRCSAAASTGPWDAA
ncbi:hypothetical protein CLAFUW4_08401 [Fulvia fulva]|uniref:Uncharacterized protein n=1 Tax=Passalora fulva TaxID=5499 RepID=A0A9Q8LDX2_PASFU|nr:uncharacterized protein CLAFUR5_08506 [Fulvia fulva]KAK4628818.1 hypothetical protein CLAFUR4_08406 [Fulvia fulva]KAK4630383.1 hypothetical protein CLAFUR0_08401 [Fulvia fulva]UJO14903.1 hypothetical protein CLAFUR5_08506 [Fulvia fulva]WPV12544.1 hypothetical protein CLAFUW4_08401 [Fulvia fulva]WPV27202.1 hypothetical protein CLAFUW7_08401 [Fulvia fulva]